MARMLIAAFLSLSIAGVPTTEARAQDAELDEWQVPWEQTRPRDPYVGPDGKVWFVGQAGHYAAFLDPNTGAFTKFDLEDGTGPHNLIVDDAGIVWYSGNRNGRHIGRIDPETGAIEKFMLPDERARDPHTLEFDHDGNIWFTVQGGNLIGKFEPATGRAQLIEAPEVEGGRSTSSRPYGIKVDSKNRPWIALFNTNHLGMVNPETMELATFELPDGARPRRLVITSDDKVYYTDYARGYLGMLDPATGEVKEWKSPSGEDARGYGMAVDKDDRVWYVEVGPQPNKFVGFDPATEEFISTVEVESGAGAIRHMYYDEGTDSIWFGTDANTVGRAKLPPKRKVT